MSWTEVGWICGNCKGGYMSNFKRDMMTGSRGRSSGSRGRSRRKVCTESPGTAQSSPFTPTTLSILVTSQVGPMYQQFIMVPNLNYVPPFATPL
ncbi:uncharacterized protein DS421_17g594110 [Arachis hypogaea]|nr:uncharacterized protein DS421_17g594110 [Arachis hypogaea]